MSVPLITYDAVLRHATRQLQAAGSPSARIDAEALLSHATGCSRTWLYTWGDQPCPHTEHTRFEHLLAQRLAGQPIAYLTGEREFWGLTLATSPSTLIPRPDTETLVEAVLARTAAPQGRLLDLGTGTGAIALAFASERPGWQVVGADIRLEAVQLAAQNARTLSLANAQFVQSDWFSALSAQAYAHRFDVIVSNPPYLADDDPHLAKGDVRFEPRSALVADDDGMADLAYLANAASGYLTSCGWLALEHGYTQAAGVRQLLSRAGYQNVESVQDVGGHERVTLGHL